MLDQYFYDRYKTNGPNALVSWWFMACYAYEILANPILTDGTFDWLAKELDTRWDEINHQHKHLIIREACKSSTAIKGNGSNGSLYPTIVQHATISLIENKSKYIIIKCDRPKSSPKKPVKTMGDLF